MGRRAWLRAKFRAAKKAAAITVLLIGGLNAALYALELSYPIQPGGMFEFERNAPYWIADTIYSLNIGGLMLSWHWIRQIRHGSMLWTWAPELIVIISGTLFWSACVGATVFWIEDPRKRKGLRARDSTPISN
jgi:hypothetical protein